MTLLAATERLSAPLDSLRRAWFELVLRSELLRAALLDRDRRIATLSCAGALLSALGAVYFPVPLFLFGPVLLGVAHVAADVRYLVLRRNLARWWQHSVWLGCLALIGLRALEELRLVRQADRVELGGAAALVGLGLFAALRDGGSRARATLALLGLGLATSVALPNPALSRFVFMHAHNLVALAAWALLFRTHRRWLVAPLLLIAVVTLALGVGLLAGQTAASPFVSACHVQLGTIAFWLAPFATGRVAIGVTTAYLFLQSVHYSTWLAWIPQDEQQSHRTLTFRMSVRSLFADLGTLGVAGFVVGGAAVLLGACFNLLRTQALYLSFATFHGYLELALLAFLWVRGADRSRAVVG
jgi:hypothetical protein